MEQFALLSSSTSEKERRVAKNSFAVRGAEWRKILRSLSAYARSGFPEYLSCGVAREKKSSLLHMLEIGPICRVNVK